MSPTCAKGQHSGDLAKDFRACTLGIGGGRQSGIAE